MILADALRSGSSPTVIQHVPAPEPDYVIPEATKFKKMSKKDMLRVFFRENEGWRGLTNKEIVALVPFEVSQQYIGSVRKEFE